MSDAREVHVVRLGQGELEATVMDILWDDGGWLTAGDVLGVMSNKRPISYTTVMTILVRLWRKDRLLRQPTGRAFAYRPTLTREEHAASRMSEILVAVKDRRTALSLFAGNLTVRDQKELRRLLIESEGPREL
jgi:predicted transcriptional regulator